MARRSRSIFEEPDANDKLLEGVRSIVLPLHGLDDLDPLIERVGEARYVLLGEASHGTAEYYDWRRRISQRLIREKGFSFIAVEGDWPPLQEMVVLSGRPDSWDDVLHESLRSDALLIFGQQRENRELFEPRGQRAIGVVYRPDTNHEAITSPRWRRRATIPSAAIARRLAPTGSGTA
jgi:erythromycin esterase-like protein